MKLSGITPDFPRLSTTQPKSLEQPLLFGEQGKLLVFKATPSNTSDLVKLYKGYIEGTGKPFSFERTKTYVQQLLQDPKSTIFVARYQGQIIGFIHIVEEIGATSLQKELYIKDWYVLPEHRGHGAAKALLAKSHDMATSGGYAKETLRTAVHNPARQLYKNQGFQEDTKSVRYERRLDVIQ